MAKLTLFSKEISPCCGYCRHGSPTKDGKYVLCKPKGVQRPDGSCGKFLYAPLKRVPKRPPAMLQFDHTDFSL